MKVLVKKDVYNICNRIKKFDSTYRIAYNNVTNKYEIYSTKLGRSVELISGVVLSYVCTLPYKELDERVIKYLYDTSVENIENIIEYIDKFNQQQEDKQHQELKQQSLLIAEDRLRKLT